MFLKVEVGQRKGGLSDAMRGSNQPWLALKRKRSQSKEYGWDLKARKGKEMVSPLESPERNTALDFSPVKPTQMSDLQNCKVINLCV